MLSTIIGGITRKKVVRVNFYVCVNTYIPVSTILNYRMVWNFCFVLTKSVHFNEHLKIVLIYSSTVFSLIHIGKKLDCYIAVEFFSHLVYINVVFFHRGSNGAVVTNIASSKKNGINKIK
jgi:hypothetical protein